MTDIPLTPRLAAKLAAIFPPEDRTFAEQWLIAECGSDLPLIHSAPELLQRVRAAALKFSQGSLDRLALATRSAQQDWRDLLMAADFGQDVHAHQAWLDDTANPNSRGAGKSGWLHSATISLKRAFNDRWKHR
jgi:hypothetical protein